MTVYAAWDASTEEYLRNSDDDTYQRPLISLMWDDDNDHTDPEHKRCRICHGHTEGMRWIPNNGGAWVHSGIWEDCQGDAERYVEKVSLWG
jgi:hypothetical protein